MSKTNFLLKLSSGAAVCIEADRILVDGPSVVFHAEGQMVASAPRFEFVAADDVLKPLPKDLASNSGALWYAPEAVQAVSVFTDCEPAALASVAVGASGSVVALVGVLSFLSGVGVVLGAAQFL